MRLKLIGVAMGLLGWSAVASFRAPNLDFPASYVPFLRDAGYTLDSSQGRHKPGSLFMKPQVTDRVRRVPASTARMTSVVVAMTFVSEARSKRVSSVTSGASAA